MPQNLHSSSEFPEGGFAWVYGGPPSGVQWGLDGGAARFKRWHVLYKLAGLENRSRSLVQIGIVSSYESIAQVYAVLDLGT